MPLSNQPKINPHSVGSQGQTPAKLSSRFIASALDASVFAGLGLLAATGIFALPSFLLTIAYICARDLIRGKGRSLGRSAAGQRLMSVHGEELAIPTIIGRNLVRSLLWMLVIPFFIDVFLVVFGGGRIIADYMFETKVFEDPEEVEKRDNDQLARARAVIEKNRQKSTQTAQTTSGARFDDDGEFSVTPSIQAKKKSLEKLEFESPDYNRRQLDDFDSRLDAVHVDEQPITVPDAPPSREEMAELERALQDDWQNLAEEEAPEEVHATVPVKRS